MPTDEFKPVLDRDRAVVDATELISLASPLLREIVNRASWAFQECQAAPINRGGENEDLAPVVLYRHLIELVDGIEVLFSASCSDASVPLIRAAFEASLSLQYILQTNYKQRSLSWTHGYVRARIKIHERFDRTTPRGAEVGTIFDRDVYPTTDPPAAYDSGPGVARLQKVLSRPGLVPIEAEFQRTRTVRKKKPDWYELFDGPHDRRELARSIGQEAQYESFYGEWSSFSHAADASVYLVEGDHPGEAAFLAVRTAVRMPQRAFLAAGYLLNATRLMTDHFRNGGNLRRWYLEDVKPLWDTLRKLEVVIK